MTTLAEAPASLPEPTRLARAIRRNALVAIHAAGSGHPGGSLSCADLLAQLYGGELPEPGRVPEEGARSRLVLSKGHAAPALYGAAAALGWIPAAELRSLRRLGSRLQGHPHVGSTPFAETSTGSLGQGFAVACGMALGLRQQRGPARSYALLGDGELQEGQVWETAMFAAHHGLDRLTALVDYNKLQSDDRNAHVLGLEPLVDRWASFGWHVQEIDGHDPEAIEGAVAAAKAEGGRPSAIVAHTVKGKGVSFMEDLPRWHGSVKMSDEELRAALGELGVPEGDPDAWLQQAERSAEEGRRVPA